jgi:hypothetical protein
VTRRHTAPGYVVIGMVGSRGGRGTCRVASQKTADATVSTTSMAAKKPPMTSTRERLNTHEIRRREAQGSRAVHRACVFSPPPTGVRSGFSNLSAQQMRPVICMTTKRVTMQPTVTARPVKPCRKKAYENNTR